ncbi:MAG: methionine adenosyltransferase [Oscillospiraceae bacterium]|nr:methionine adenosyltransferase [Oscillospiraceae bacterium]
MYETKPTKLNPLSPFTTTTLFTSESVTEGHPDKVADSISDSILDEYLSIDADARVAVEVLVKGKNVVVAGEITSFGIVDIDRVVRKTIAKIGYDDDRDIFSANNCIITKFIETQSKDIALGVDISLESKSGGELQLGAGDQGMMFGYACGETDEKMPLSISLAHRLTKRLAYLRHNHLLSYLRPDGKAQVTVEYQDGRISRVDTVVISTQHSEKIDIETLRQEIREQVIYAVIPNTLIDEHTNIYINPTGRFVVGGPEGDCGLTGRKIIVDSYGGVARHGGGCFSGKDPTKVDRSAAYMARYIAKNVVAASLADRCELQISYAIGVAEPVSVFLETNRDEQTNECIRKAILDVFDMRPTAVIEQLRLRRPIYAVLSCYGHMGREDLGVLWEQTDRTEQLIAAFNLHSNISK